MAPLVAIGGLALVVRLAFALAFSRTPIGSMIYLDSRTYDELAMAIRDGTGAAFEPFFVEPLYAYLLAAIYGLFGRELWVVRILQALGGAGVAVLTFGLARRLYGRRVAWAAGVAAALYGPFVFYDALLLKSSGEILIAALLAWRLARDIERPEGIVPWAATGAFLGMGVLLKANFLILGPVVLGAPLLLFHRQRRLALQRSAAAALGLALALLPFVVLNSVLAGEPTFLTHNAGMNFFQGNREGTDGGLDIPLFIRSDPASEQTDSLAEARRRAGDPDLSPAEASSFWFGESFRYIRAQPGAWLLLMGRKVLLFWNWYEAADNLSFHYTRQVVPWLWLAPVGFWLVGSLGLAGTLAGAGGGRPEWLLRAMVALLMVGTVLFHVADRYRLAAVPMLIVLGAGFAGQVVASWKEGNRLKVGLGLALALGTALIVNVPDFYPGGQVMAPYDSIMALGYAQQGDEARAAEYGDRAARYHYDRALALLEHGHVRRAEVNLLQIPRLSPELPGLWYHLGVTEERLGQPAQAVQFYAREAAEGPFGVAALTRLAALQLREGRLAEAEEAVQRGRAIDPRDPALLVVAGDLHAAQGRLDEALDLFESALALDPGAAPIERRIELVQEQLQEQLLE